MNTPSMILMTGCRRPSAWISAVASLLLVFALPLPAQLLTHLRSFPDRISVGDPQIATNDLKEGPKGIASADFNADGIPDLAVGNLDGTITVLLGQGSGTFAPPRHLRTGTQELRAVLAVDLNGDSKPDLAAASPMDGKLLIYFNGGGGVFGAATALEGWIGVRSLAAGDFDGDGITDLAAAGPGLGVRHFRGTGGGAFTIMGDLPRLSPLVSELPRPVYTLRTLRSRDGRRDDLLVTHAESAALWILSTVADNRRDEPPMDLSRLPAWRSLESPVLLHEVQVQNATTLLDADGTAQPWVELLNKSDAPVNLAGWTLRSESQMWTLPAITIEPGRLQIVFLSGKDRTTGPELHTSFLLKQNSKDLSLNQPGGSVANTFALSAHAVTDISIGLAPDLDAVKYFDIPSPGAANNAGLNNLDDIHSDSITSVTITPRYPSPRESVMVRVAMPEHPTGTSAVRNMWFSATPGLYEYHHVLRRKSAGIYETVLPPGAFSGGTPYRVLARLRDGVGNDYTSEVYRSLDEAKATRIASPQPGRLLPVASVPSRKVKAFELGAVATRADQPEAPLDLVLVDDTSGVLRMHRAAPGARRFDPIPSQDVPVRGAPRDVKLADIDGDGWLDATVVLRSLDLAVTYKNQSGLLRATGELPTGRSPREAVMADFTGDGTPDAAIINRYSADVSILPSSANQSGLVSLDQIYPVNGDVAGLTVKDVNGDGRDDVMQLHRARGEISIRLASPDGTLAAPVFRSTATLAADGTGETPSGIAIGDVNNDGRLDMLTANLGGGGSISVLLANAAGSYDSPRTFTSGGGMFAIALADFDADGYQDVVAGLFDCRVAFFRGDGTGRFTATYSVPFVYESRVMVTGDFDQDGDVDIAGAGYAGDVVTLENRGAATAGSWTKQVYPAPTGAYGTHRIAVSNVNFDLDPDLVIGTGGGITVFTGAPGMGFELAPEYGGGLGVSVSDVLTADLDGDGKLEMVAACRNASCINILTQNEAGEFGLVTQADVPSGRYLASGDIDGDGKPDLVGTGDVLWTVLSSRPPQIAAPGTTETTSPESSEVVINEVLSQNTGVPIPTDGGRKTDFVEVFNGSSTDTDLSGWKVRLQSTQDGAALDQTWSLPATPTPAKGHAVLLFSSDPDALHAGFALPAEGGTLTLLRPDGSPADRVEYPPAQENVSWSRYLDGHRSFHADRIPSPGMSNLDNGTAPPDVKLAAPSPAKMIAGQALRFTAKGRDDAGILSLSLLWNRLDAPLSQPQRIVMYDDGMHQDEGAVDGLFAGQLTPGLPPGAEVQFYLEAVDLSGEVVLLPDSAELVEAGKAPVAWSFSLTAPPALEITEVVTNNLSGPRDDVGGHADSVKVRNVGAVPVDLSGVLLAKSPLSGTQSVYSYPAGLTLPPAGEITVFADNNPSQGALHAPFTLDAGGDDLALLAMTPSGARQWIHSVRVPASPPDSTYRRLPGTELRALIGATDDLTNWSGIAMNANDEAMVTVHFAAPAGSSFIIEGDAAGAPEVWAPLQFITGDGAVHTVAYPISEMDDLRIKTHSPPPSLRVEAVPVTATGAVVFIQALRATEVTVFYGPTNGGVIPNQWASSQVGTAPFVEVPLVGLTPNTTYYYHVRALNAAGQTWASPAGTTFRFKTLPLTTRVPDAPRLIALNPSEARVEFQINPAPPPGSTVTVLAGTVDAFADESAWQREVLAVPTGVKDTWGASLFWLEREKPHFVRAALTTPAGRTISAQRLVFRTPDALENLALNLRLSEIMYNPAPPTAAEAEAGFEQDDFEFIELQNDSNESMDLSGLWFEDGLEFDFPFTGAPVLPPGGFAVIAANPQAFAMRFGADIPLAGWTLHPFRKARLGNGGETIALRSASGTLLFQILYNDRPRQTDGGGFSLEFQRPSDPYRPEMWTDYDASRIQGGTPGRAPLPRAEQTYAEWRSLYFDAGQLIDPAVSGMVADPDDDGLTNFAEYACGTRPLLPDANGVLTIRDNGFINGNKALLLTFPTNILAKEAIFNIQGLDQTLTTWYLDAADVTNSMSISELGWGASFYQGAYVRTSGYYRSSQELSPDQQHILVTILVVLEPNGPWTVPPLDFASPDLRLFRLHARRSQ